jgi:NAD+ kinase
MKIAIFYNSQTNPRNAAYAQEAAEALDRFGLEHATNPLSADIAAFDLALTVGGDGTFLYAANLLAEADIPLLGVNFGHRGYLCQARRDTLGAAAAALSECKYDVVEKTRILAEIRKRENGAARLEALNEISVGGINRTVYLSAAIRTPEKTIETRITGDGLIVSTQTGSTAYNLNAGGPMLLTDAFSIVANNSYFESDCLLPATRSIVTSPQATIHIQDLSHNPANLPFVIADGIHAQRLEKTDSIFLQQSPHPSRFLHFTHELT